MDCALYLGNQLDTGDTAGYWWAVRLFTLSRDMKTQEQAAHR